MKCKNNRGQLSLGLAAAFTMVIAILGLVLRSGVITREKMKMQQTSDFAALGAADVQRRMLNQIREINLAIDEDFKKTQVALTALPKPCETMYASAFGMMNCDQVSLITSKFSGEKVEGENDSEAGGNGCGCKDFDAGIRNQIIKAYNRRKSERSATILNIIGNGNQVTGDFSLTTFLTPNNLPLGLQQWVGKKFGPSVTKEILKNEYLKGELKTLFNVIEASREMPLFQPKLEIRPFEYQKYSYVCVGIRGMPSQCQANFIPRPTFALTTAKVVREGNYNTSFITGATYSSTGEDGISKWKMYVKNRLPEKEKFGKPIEDIRGKKISMFQERVPMTVMSLAKPYGGSFPEEGPPGLGGPSGDEFKGAKLIGLADEAQVGVRLPLGGKFETRDAEGKPTSTQEFFNEDYLH